MRGTVLKRVVSVLWLTPGVPLRLGLALPLILIAPLVLSTFSNGVDLIQQAHHVDEIHAPSLLPGLGLQQIHSLPRPPPEDDVLRQIGEEPVHPRAA